MDDLRTSCLYYEEAMILFEDINMDSEALRHSKKVAELYYKCVYNESIMALIEREILGINKGVYILGALLHDIGKACIPDDCLNKKESLTSNEYNIIKCHAELGKLVTPIINSRFKLTDAEYDVIYKMIELHHENQDGTGYPYGLSGDSIPIYVKILTVLDVYDALVSKRSYKKALPNEVALDIIANESGRKFDSEVLNLLQSWGEKETLVNY